MVISQRSSRVYLYGAWIQIQSRPAVCIYKGLASLAFGDRVLVKLIVTVTGVGRRYRTAGTIDGIRYIRCGGRGPTVGVALWTRRTVLEAGRRARRDFHPFSADLPHLAGRQLASRGQS